jgi:hypothetical protein
MLLLKSGIVVNKELLRCILGERAYKGQDMEYESEFYNTLTLRVIMSLWGRYSSTAQAK